MQKKELLRIFISSFLITIIVFCFIMGFVWVDLMSNRNGFDGFLPSLRLEKLEPLLYRLSTATDEIELDFAPADYVAQKLQRFEAWILPENWRVFTRTSLYIKEQFAAHKRLKQQQEFYKNAGLV